MHTLPELVPTGVYAIPEIGMVGATEEELTDRSEPYVSGIARWSELARGLMTGDEDGMLKLLVSPEDKRVLGVHVIGTGATELVHIGQAVMAQGAGGLDFLVTAVFNYPTFAESYKVAALDAANRIRSMSRGELSARYSGEPGSSSNTIPPSSTSSPGSNPRASSAAITPIRRSRCSTCASASSDSMSWRAIRRSTAAPVTRNSPVADPLDLERARGRGPEDLELRHLVLARRLARRRGCAAGRAAGARARARPRPGGSRSR